MYYMHWTLDDVRSLTMDQLNWATASLSKIKREEARAFKKAGRR